MKVINKRRFEKLICTYKFLIVISITKRICQLLHALVKFYIKKTIFIVENNYYFMHDKLDYVFYKLRNVCATECIQLFCLLFYILIINTMSKFYEKLLLLYCINKT